MSLRGAEAITVAFLLAACAGPTQPGGAPVTQEETELTAIQHFERKRDLACDPGREHWRVQGTPKRGGTFSRANINLPHLDVTAPMGNSHYTAQVYEHLVETRACYYEDTVMVPGLAQSWEVSPDGKTWTLKLRQDVKWANKAPVTGRPFTAADVVWTIEHQKAGGQLRSAWQPVQYETPDQHTIILRLAEADADFLGNVLGERLNYILPREIKEQYGDFKQMAAGTGPYMLKTYTPLTRVTLERNPDYREMGVDGKPLPYIDEIDMLVMPDYAAEVAAMRTGQLDLNQVTGYLKRDADALRAANPKFVVYQDVAPIPRGLWMRLDMKPFDDIRVRKALFYAIDHDEIIEGGYQGGAMRTGHMPAAIIDFAWPPSKVREKFKPDRERSKQLLAEAGYGPDNPLKFTMKSGTPPQDSGGAEVVQNHLKLVGVDAQIELTPTLVASTISARDYHAAWGGISPASIFPNRWMGGFLRCGDSRNYTNLCDPEIDRLSRAQESELDKAKRKVLLDQLQDKLYDTMPYVPTQSLIYYRFYSCRIKNIPSTDYTQQLSGIARAWLDPTGC